MPTPSPSSPLSTTTTTTTTTTSAADVGLLLGEAEAPPLRAGDYTVVVHVIEGRSLHPEDCEGTSDPVVYVEVGPFSLGGSRSLFRAQTQHTRIVPAMNDPVFDTTLVFALPSMSHAALDDARITFRVFDADFLTKTLIGEHSVELTSAYRSPGHELHREWLGLVDASTAGAGTFEGMLLVSVEVLGPGDVPVTHAPPSAVSGRGEESASETCASESIRLPLGLSSFLFKMLEITVHEAEGLPAVSSLRSAITPYVRLELGGAPQLQLRTKANTIFGERELSVTWMETLAAPLLLPTLADRVSLSLWDKGISGDTRLGTLLPLSFRALLAAQERSAVAVTEYESRTTNNKNNSRWSSTKAVNTNTTNTTTSSSTPLATPQPWAMLPSWLAIYGPFPALDAWGTSASEATSRMRRVPSASAAYLGSLLVSIRVIEAGKTQAERRPMVRAAKPTLGLDVYPRRALHALRVTIFSGADLPPRKSPLGVLVVCGGLGVGTRKVMVGRVLGDATWNETLQTTLLLPRDATSLPDTFIYLYEGDATSYRALHLSNTPPLNTVGTTSSGSARAGGGAFRPLSFTRIPTAPLIAAGSQGVPAHWYRLKEDTSVNALSDSVSAGEVLVRIALSAVSADDGDVGGDVDDWLHEVRDAEIAEPYELRVHCYRARNLVSADADGSSDPFLEVNFAGVTAKTSIREKTRNPGWFETLRLDNVMLSGKNASRLAPPVAITLWDYDEPSKVFGARADKQGELRFDLRSEHVIVTPKEAAGEPLSVAPQWYSLTSLETGAVNRNTARGEADDVGAVLLSFQLIPKGRVDTVLAPPASILPLMREVILEITALGLRDLRIGLLRSGRSDALAAAGEQALVSSVNGVNATPAGTINSMLISPYMEFDAESSCGVVTGSSSSVKRTTTTAAAAVLSSISTSKNGSFIVRTQSSSRPSPQNAAFCERLLLPISLPIDPLYCGVINVKLKDKRTIGGDVAIASGEIDLNNKLFWKQGFRPARGAAPGDDVHPHIDTSINTPAALAKAVQVRKNTVPSDGGGGGGDASVGGTTGIYSGSFAGTSSTNEGAILSPASQHNDMDVSGTDLSRFMKTRDCGSLASDDIEIVYLNERREYARGLEDVFGGAVFERISLRAGQSVGGGLFSASTRVIGALKCVVRVLPPISWAGENTSLTPLAMAPPPIPSPSPTSITSSSLDLTLLRSPVSCIVRVYVLTAEGLIPKDSNGKSDPYLRLVCGETSVSNRLLYLPATLNPEFYQVLELRVNLPGPPTLRIEMWDRNDISSDTAIGATCIDIEDRWYDPSWQGLPRKPIETRNLWSPLSTASQGVVRMWIDILPAGPNHFVPAPWKIARPPPTPLEVRVCVFRTADVPSYKGNDYYIKARLESTYASTAAAPGRKARAEGRDEERQETDVHFRAKRGEANFNWRFVFRPSHPCSDPRLTLQLYERDEYLALTNNQLGVHTLHLGHAINKAAAAAAVSGGRAVQLFETQLEVVGDEEFAKIDEERKDKATKSLQQPLVTVMQGLTTRAGKLRRGLASNAAALGRGIQHHTTSAMNARVLGIEDGASGGNTTQKNEMDSETSSATSGSAKDTTTATSSKGGKGAAAQVTSTSAFSLLTGGFSPVNAAESIAKQTRLSLEPPVPLPRHATWLTFRHDLHRKEAEKALATGEFFTLNALIVGCRRTFGCLTVSVDRETASAGLAKREFGRVLVSVEILPSTLAQKYKAGLGRAEPNEFPALPAPRGRLKCTFNPCVLLYECLGPARCLKLAVVFGGVIAIALSFTGLPFFTSLISLVNLVPAPLQTLIECAIGLAVAYILISCVAPQLLCCCTSRPETLLVFGSATEAEWKRLNNNSNTNTGTKLSSTSDGSGESESSLGNDAV